MNDVLSVVANFRTLYEEYCDRTSRDVTSLDIQGICGSHTKRSFVGVCTREDVWLDVRQSL